jgi:hypothetical protein
VVNSGVRDRDASVGRWRGRLLTVISTVVVALLSPSLPAGAVVPAWTTTISAPDEGIPIGMAHLEDGSSFVLLELVDNAFDEWGDCRLARVDPSGTVAWIRTIAAGDRVDCHAIALNGDALYLTFSAQGPVDGAAGTDGWATYVRRYTFDAGLVWSHFLSTTYSQVGWGISASGAAVYVSGSVSIEPEPGSDAFVRAYDVDGDVLWTRYDRSTGDDVYTRAVAEGDGVIVSGYDNDTDGYFFTRYDSGGGIVYREHFDAPRYTYVLDIALQGHRLIAGGYTDGTFPGQQFFGGEDAFVATIRAANGTTMRARQFGTPWSDVVRDIEVGPLAVYVTGTTNGALPRFHHRRHDNDVFIRAYGLDGARGWTRQFGSSLSDDSVAIGTDASGVVVLGWTNGELRGEPPGESTFLRRFESA